MAAGCTLLLPGSSRGEPRGVRACLALFGHDCRALLGAEPGSPCMSKHMGVVKRGNETGQNNLHAETLEEIPFETLNCVMYFVHTY
eukprot:4245200-Amphidinium_carterae.1